MHQSALARERKTSLNFDTKQMLRCKLPNAPSKKTQIGELKACQPSLQDATRFLLQEEKRDGGRDMWLQ